MADRGPSAAVSLLLLPANLAWRGLVLVKLWAWFVLPLHPAIPRLGVWWAAGLMLMAGYLTHQLPRREDEDDISLLGQTVRSAATAGLTLLLGWGAHALAF